MPAPIVTLTTDFGLSDPYVGAMKGVILGICPRAQLVDITHLAIPFAIAEGAFREDLYHRLSVVPIRGQRPAAHPDGSRGAVFRGAG